MGVLLKLSGWPSAKTVLHRSGCQAVFVVSSEFVKCHTDKLNDSSGAIQWSNWTVHVCALMLPTGYIGKQSNFYLLKSLLDIFPMYGKPYWLISHLPSLSFDWLLAEPVVWTQRRQTHLSSQLQWTYQVYVHILMNISNDMQFVHFLLFVLKILEAIFSWFQQASI